MKLRFLLAAWLAAGLALAARADAVWQWSAPVGAGRAFLWIPPSCRQVRGVVVGQHNMIEEGILQHPHFRVELARLGLAEIFIAPPCESWQDATNNAAANERFNALLQALAAESGYGELALAPVVPLGHSAYASYPWNFAAWNPARTLAILSVHGDAPQTSLVGNGRPNVDWGGRGIDGIPGLMVMAEYEWWEDRLTPAAAFRAAHPAAPVALLAEPGRGHFDYSDKLVDFLALFIRKAAELRLPETMPRSGPVSLKPVDPRAGWLVQRWKLNAPRTVRPAPFAKYAGDAREAFWASDREMALAVQNYYADQPGKRPQLLGLVQDSEVLPQTDSHQQVSLRFEPLADGVTFHLSAKFLEAVPGGSKNPARWAYLPAGSPLGHAQGGGPVRISRITGPVEQVNADTFAVRFNRACVPADRRAGDIWLLAEQPGDARFKSAVQQALLKIPFQLKDGAEQHIAFPPPADVRRNVTRVKLAASSDAGVPVGYYVREGPAEVAGDTLRLTAIPPRARFPVKVTVVAWQYGRVNEPKLKSAEPVERSFYINP